MRRAFLFLGLGLLLSAIFFLFIDQNSPFDSEKLDEIILAKEIEPENYDALEAELEILFDRGLILEIVSLNAYVAFFLSIFSICFFFIFIHMSLDKLFFKNFYEKPDFSVALRRAMILFITGCLIFYLKLNALDTVYLILVGILAIFAEIAYLLFFKEKIGNESDQNAQEDSHNQQWNEEN